MPSSRALNGARVPSAIIWKPVTLPTASQTSLSFSAGHEGAGVRAVLPSTFAGTAPATPASISSVQASASSAARAPIRRARGGLARVGMSGSTRADAAGFGPIDVP